MRILVTGAKGMLGTDLVKKLSIKNDVKGVDVEDFDITDEAETIRGIKKIFPKLVINTAAFTDVDACEKEREVAFKVNRVGARNVAAGCYKVNARFIHISTDYVFNGEKKEPYKEDDEPGPVNVYGQSKLEGEQEISRLQTSDFRLQTLIIRTSWLYGKNGRNFVDTILRLANEKDEIRVVDDQTGSPTYTVDLSESIERLIDSDAAGIVHCSNSGECSWYDFAKEIIRIKGIKGVNVIPIESGEMKRPATRPSYSVLSNEKCYKLTGHRIRRWEDGLRDYLRIGTGN